MTDRQLDRLSRRVSWTGVLLVAATVLLLGWAWHALPSREIPLPESTREERRMKTQACAELMERMLRRDVTMLNELTRVENRTMVAACH